MSFIVAVDGPSGTGKGTITKLVSEKFGFQYLDTGAMYRCVTLKLLNEKIDTNLYNRTFRESIYITFSSKKIIQYGKN